MVYLVGGSGIFESAPTGSVEVRAGTVFVLFPGVWHRYGPRETDQWREYWTIFDGFIPERYRAAGLLDPARPFFEMGQDSDVERCWKECLHLAETGGAGHCRVLSERTFALFGHIYANARVEPAGQSHTRQLVESVVALLEEHMSDGGFRLESHAARFAMSYSALRQRFAAAVGVPPATYLAQMRMQRAQARLLVGHEPVKAIAAELGFPDQYHFSRRFKQLVGLSPEAFRREFRTP
jgi:AraC-like DNA-binding protein